MSIMGMAALRHQTIQPVLAALGGLALCVSAEWCVAEERPQPKSAPVFDVQVLFESVRIPNIVVATDGTVLAFAKSGRLLRRSEDGGKTFSPAREVGHDAGGSAIVDRNTGDVMVVNPAGPHLWRSRNHGKTWSREKIVVKPNPLGHGDAGGVPAHTGCSESGLTLRCGKHKGRLLMPARVQPPKANNDQEWSVDPHSAR